jgi:hypothetical protein
LLQFSLFLYLNSMLLFFIIIDKMQHISQPIIYQIKSHKFIYSFASLTKPNSKPQKPNYSPINQIHDQTKS